MASISNGATRGGIFLNKQQLNNLYILGTNLWLTKAERSLLKCFGNCEKHPLSLEIKK